MRKLGIYLPTTIMVLLTVLATSCGNEPEPEIIENGTKTLIEIQEIPTNNCRSSTPVHKKREVFYEKVRKTYWELGSEVGFGIPVPISDIFMLDIDAKLFAKYSQEISESNSVKTVDEWDIPAGTQKVSAYFFRVVHHFGEMKIQGKTIKYDYRTTAELVGDSKYEVPCDPILTVQVVLPMFEPTVDASIDLFIGAWVNEDALFGDISEIDVSSNGGVLTAHVYSQGLDSYLDWGEGYVYYTGVDPTIMFYFGYKTTALTMQLSGDTLIASVLDQYEPTTSPAKIQDQKFTYYLLRK